MTDISALIHLISIERAPVLNSDQNIITIHLKMESDAFDRWRNWTRSPARDDEHVERLPMETFGIDLGVDFGGINLDINNWDIVENWHLAGEIRNGVGDISPPSLCFTLWDSSDRTAKPLNGDGEFRALDDKEYAAEISGTERTPGISHIRIVFQKERKIKKV